MKAVICTAYGPPEVLKVIEIPKPIPKSNEILIKNYATTCHIGDTRVRGFHVPAWQSIPFRIYLGITKPRHPVLGMELSGVVETMGKGVKRFKAGDEVFAFTGFGFGAYAEYTCIAEDSKKINNGMVTQKPGNLSFAEAAAGFTSGGVVALAGLRNSNIIEGKKVLIYGASGSVGTFAVQLAKHYSTQITGVCSAGNFELVKALGADNVIDYTSEDLTKYGADYDIVFDAVGKLSSKTMKNLLSKNGKYRKVGADNDITINDLYFIKDLAEQGELEPVIDRTYSIDDIVEAHRYVEQGHKKGHVVITIMEEEDR